MLTESKDREQHEPLGEWDERRKQGNFHRKGGKDRLKFGLKLSHSRMYLLPSSV